MILNSFKNKVDTVRQIIGREPSTEELIEHITDMTEKEISEMDVDLTENFELASTKPNFFDNYQKKKKELEQLMETWELLQSAQE